MTAREMAEELLRQWRDEMIGFDSEDDEEFLVNEIENCGFVMTTSQEDRVKALYELLID